MRPDAGLRVPSPCSRRPHPMRMCALAGVLMLLPGQALASDFSGLMLIAWGITAIVAALLGLVAWLLTRGRRGIARRALVWGPWLALVATPLRTEGGNGTSSGPPLLDLLLPGFGADPVYAGEALKALLVSVPVGIGLVALLLWARPGRAAADTDTGTDAGRPGTPDG